MDSTAGVTGAEAEEEDEEEEDALRCVDETLLFAALDTFVGSGDSGGAVVDAALLLHFEDGAFF